MILRQVTQDLTRIVDRLLCTIISLNSAGVASKSNPNSLKGYKDSLSEGY